MSKLLDKRAKEIILHQMEELGEITTESVMELVRPHYNFDVRAAREREIRKKSNGLMAQFRDQNGIRTCYNYEDLKGESKYINIDKTFDLDALDGVNRQISAKFNGLHRARKKIAQRASALGGQLEMFQD